MVAPGVPERVPWPLPLSTNVTPLGSAPDSLMAAVGLPVVKMRTMFGVLTAIVSLPEAPRLKVGACSTVSVKLCVAAVPIPLLAVMVMA